MRCPAGIAMGLTAIVLMVPSAASAAPIDVTISTDTVVDDSQCSLREAVSSANINDAEGSGCASGEAAAQDVIQLDPATTYGLAGTIDEFSNAGGDLNVNAGASGVRIQGAGAGSTTIDSLVNDRVIHMSSGPVEIQGVTITGGNEAHDGGGIHVAGSSSLALTSSTVSANMAASTGGGILVGTSAGLTLTGSSVTDNDAPYGGGIQVNGTMTTVTLNSSTVSGNDSTNEGGGINSGGVLTLTESVIATNSASTVENAVNGNSPRGGGIYTNTGTVTIDDSSITGNDASTSDPEDSPFGGGAYFGSGTVTIRDSTFSGNQTFGGASIGDDYGGGIYNSAGLKMRNSTISGNHADSRGGGLRNTGGVAQLAHVTFSGNTAPIGPALEHEQYNPGPGLTLRGSLIANGALACSTTVGGLPITSTGYNVAQGSSCVLAHPTDLTNVADPMIGPLANNGGLTQTHALLAGSPAIDRVPVADCDDENGAPLTTDQRGMARPYPAGGACDVGAYEFSPPPVTGGGGSPAVNPACVALRAKLKKAKTKKKKKKLRAKLKKLGC